MAGAALRHPVLLSESPASVCVMVCFGVFRDSFCAAGAALIYRRSVCCLCRRRPFVLRFLSACSGARFAWQGQPVLCVVGAHLEK